ncbi:MAG: molybdopterin synthase sulfur carrier subunit [Hadesarchaea archaeon]|nr:MAG: molybdopterin synthase sulfur carrier subunit [Hadesarchaea archaeon]TDA36424.1 MAG: molybdopterin synthase sulfur carrier subunit [Hadesarchaea archaeon]
MVKVKFFAKFRELAGTGEMEVGAEDVRSLLLILKERKKELGEALMEGRGTNLRKTVKVLVNGREIRWLKGVDTPLRENDVVYLFPPVGGG